MAGLLGYAAAGALQGFGSGLKEQALQQRDAMLRQMGWDREDAQRREDRSFQAGQREADRSFQREMRADDRAYSDQEWTRRRAAEVEDRDFAARTGAVSGGSRDPADIAAARQIAQWRASAQNREPTDQDFMDAYEQVKTGVARPEARLRAINDLYKLYSDDFSDNRSPAEKRKAAEAEVDRLLGSGAREPAAPAAPAAQAAPSPRGDRPDAGGQSEIAPSNGGGLMPKGDRPGADGPNQAVTETTPRGYPDARWSDQHKAWFVQRNGRWVRLDAASGARPGG